MQEQQFLWRTDGEGVLAAEVNGYRLTVERVLPSSAFRFVVTRADDDHSAAARSGSHHSVKEAILAAEQTAVRMLSLRRAGDGIAGRVGAIKLTSL